MMLRTMDAVACMMLRIHPQDRWVASEGEGCGGGDDDDGEEAELAEGLADHTSYEQWGGASAEARRLRTLQERCTL